MLGFGRGTSDWEDPPRFYHFHPDEDRLVDDALNLENPFTPPPSSYGPISQYALRGAVELAALLGIEPASGFSAPENGRVLFLIARLLALVLAMLTLWFLYHLAVHLCGDVGAVVAVFFYAFSPLAVQQAHFYAIDGLFTVASLGALWAISRALNADDWRTFVFAGAMIGGASAVRLVGLGLVVVFVLASLAGHRRSSKPALAAPTWVNALAGRISIGIGTALATLLVCAPYLLTTAVSMLSAGLRVGSGLELTGEASTALAQLRADAVGVARGTILRPWSLVDMHTVPYLHQLTHLWPQAAGWPLAITAGAAVVWSTFRLSGTRAAMLMWGAIYFGVIGSLHTKHVRYLLPLLPLCSLLAADLCLTVRARYRTAGTIGLGLLMVATAAQGVAFARIYVVEDSRLQAARWLAQNAPDGSRIGVEGGAFSLNPLVSGVDFRKRHLEISELYRSRGYLMCAPALAFLKQSMDGLDYVLITDANRYRHFRAVPEMFPVVAEFYGRLLEGRLGFELVREIRVYPSLAGIELRDDDAEPAFVGFDHPTTWILRRVVDTTAAGSWEEWRRGLDSKALCADGPLRRAANALKRGQWESALLASDEVLTRFPEMKSAHLIQAAAHQELGQLERTRRSLVLYRSPYRLDASARGPWATAANLVELDLAKLVTWMHAID